jgi:membrane-associated phospholipid phosphatase
MGTLAALRPAERVLALFLAYALARLALAGDVHLATHAFPPVDLLVAFALVVALRLASEYRRVPWPEGTRDVRREHTMFLAACVLISGLAVALVPRFRPHPGMGGGAATELVLAIHAWTFTGLLFATPFAILWLASAQHIKEHGRLDSRAMLRARRADALEALREWAPLLVLLYAYGLMEPVIGRGLFPDMDPPLGRLDRFLFLGHDPRILLEPFITPWLSTWLAACYALYVPLIPIVAGVVFARRDPAPFRELVLALTLTLAIGYVVYTLVPVRGPMFVDRYDVALDGYYGDWIKRDLLDPNRVPRDCFPSLHTAVSFTLLWGAFRHARRVFWVALPIVACIPLACVYFRYHYVVDVIAGALLFAAVRTVALRALPR